MFDTYFAPPGVGKTTWCCYLAKWYKRKYPNLNVYCNVPIHGCIYIDDVNDIGKYLISDGLLLLDEVGVCFNSRQFKNFDTDKVKFFKYHRHFNLDVVLCSQSYNDMDLILRNLCTRYFLLKRGWLFPVVTAYMIKKRIGINELSRDIQDEYFFLPRFLQVLTSKRIWAPRYYKMFDSYDRYFLPEKEFRYIE